MSTAGRRPKPTALKLVAGNPGKRALNPNEPQPDLFTETPPAPDFLDEDARAHWDKTAPQLVALNLLTQVDADAFALYCNAFSVWLDASRKVGEFGSIVKSPKSGMPLPSPYLIVANQAFNNMLRLQTEFGMTPSSRSKVSVAGAAKPQSNRFLQHGRRPGASA